MSVFSDFSSLAFIHVKTQLSLLNIQYFKAKLNEVSFFVKDNLEIRIAGIFIAR